MAETMTTTSGTEEERPRCRAGSKTDHPCWREATTAAHFDPDERRYCAEHAEVIRLGKETDELFYALEKMGEWIAAEVKPDTETTLQRHAYTMRERVEDEYWATLVEASAARLIADQPAHEKRLSCEQARRLGALMLRSDALGDARVALEDAPEQLIVRPSRRWQMVAALKSLHTEVNAEYGRCKREIGLE